MTAFVFLSASIPDPKRDPRYMRTADVVAIRDAVRGLATVVLPRATLIWGGHPAITPLVRVVADGLSLTGRDHVRLFQSAFFARKMPKDNRAFESVTIVPKVGRSRERSLEAMRRAMISSAAFDAGVFIGGMEGVEDEFALFRELQPQARLLPIASTGGAALELLKRNPDAFPRELVDDFAYVDLFRRLLFETGALDEH